MIVMLLPVTIFTGKSAKHGYGHIIELLSFAFIGKLTQRMSSMIDIVILVLVHSDLSDNGILRSSHLCIQALVKFHSEIWVCDSETLRFSPKQRVSLSNSEIWTWEGG